MLEEKLNLDNIPHFKQAELDRRMDDVLQLIDEGHSPVMIHDRNDRRFLMFAWEDFFNRFGWLYTKEEKAATAIGPTLVAMPTAGGLMSGELFIATGPIREVICIFI